MTYAAPWLDRDLIARALAEDIGRGDVTTQACVPADAQARARIIARQPGTVAGLSVALEVLRQVDPALEALPQAQDGAAVVANAPLLHLVGAARSILTAERVALNFLGRLCGIATLTAACVAAAGRSPGKRATATPGVRG